MILYLRLSHLFLLIIALPELIKSYKIFCILSLASNCDNSFFLDSGKDPTLGKMLLGLQEK